jgi:hypothetical protein
VTTAIVFAVNLVFVAALVGLVHWLGRSLKASLDSPETAKTLFLAEYPDAKIGEIAITGEADGAVLVLEGGRAIGLVTSMGAHWLVRRIGPESLGSANVTASGRVIVHLADFTAPHLTLDLGSDKQASIWCRRLQNLRELRAAEAARPLEAVGA